MYTAYINVFFFSFIYTMTDLENLDTLNLSTVLHRIATCVRWLLIKVVGGEGLLLLGSEFPCLPLVFLTALIHYNCELLKQ